MVELLPDAVLVHVLVAGVRVLVDLDDDHSIGDHRPRIGANPQSSLERPELLPLRVEGPVVLGECLLEKLADGLLLGHHVLHGTRGANVVGFGNAKAPHAQHAQR
jgi:hypothetical protein